MATQAARKDHYVGQTQRFLRDGFGVYNYGNSFFRYEGEWKKGRKHGHGKFVMGDGSYYEGQFKDGEIEGYGFKYYASSGSSYTGEFHQGEPQGQGVFKYKNGTVYEGAWERGKRSGYGTLKAADNCGYEGFFYENMRHGEGAQTYINGDRYDGDWVLDKRQGHGELRQQDGTIYDGQWRQDMMNGQGSMIHSSGCIYEGIWINNYPATMPTKMVIVMETNEIEENMPFTVRVECHGDDGEIIKEDKGRELQVSAGFKWQPSYDPQPVKEGAGLFEVIEDFQESPVTTPFGYDVVSYPLTDQQSGVSMVTDINQTQSSSDITLESQSKTEVGGDDEITKETKLEETVKAEEDTVSPKPTSPNSVTNPEENVNVDESVDNLTVEGTATTETGEVKSREETPLLPPVSSKRTEEGCCMWEELQLAPPPPMYRPFVMLDNEGQKSNKSKQQSEKSKSKKTEEDSGLLRPGEYVIMVQDVTSPAFMGKTLHTAFALLTVRQKKKTTGKRESKQKCPNGQ